MDVEPIEVSRRGSAGLSWLTATRAPHPGLSSYVSGYCGYAEHADLPVRRRQVANAQVALIFSFGDSIDLVSMTNCRRPTGRFRSFVAGFHAGHSTTEYIGRQRGVQVNLAPLGVYRLLGIPASELANQVISVDDLPGTKLTDLADRLAWAPDWHARFELLDRALLSWADEGSAADPAVTWAWNQLKRSHGEVTVGKLSDEIGWSRRHFVARFRQQVGIPPKPCGRVLRFDHAVRLLKGQDSSSITDIAALCGYADHSHMNRDFRLLAGYTPSDHLAALQSEAGRIAG